MAKKRMVHSVKTDTRYQRINDKPDMYESLWGTPGTKASKVTKTITIAKHPVMTWALDLKSIISRKGHTDAERLAVLDMISRIDELGDFTGTQVFNLDVPSDGMRFQAMIIRITDQKAR